MRLPISTILGPDHYVIKVLVPGRGADDLPEILISRTPGDRRIHILVCNGIEEVGEHWIND